MTKTIQEINEKIRTGKVVVITAEEAVGMVKEKGVKAAAAKVDVVTTGTFSPMCSSGAYFNLKQPTPKMKLGGGWASLKPDMIGISRDMGRLPFQVQDLPRSPGWTRLNHSTSL